MIVPALPLSRANTIERYVCNSLDEVLAHDGRPFDVVVVGAGMYGAYVAAKLLRLRPSSPPRVLVLDAGPFLLAEHVQNSSYLDYRVFEPIYGLPYLSNVPVAPHYYVVGGKGLGWGKWSPRLTEADLQRWPVAAAEWLRAHYAEVEEEIGVTPYDDLIHGDLYTALHRRVTNVLDSGLVPPAGSLVAQPPPIAVQCEAPAPGLYSPDAFTSLSLLLEAIHDDSAAVGFDLRWRNVFLVPQCRVVGLDMAAGRVTGLQLVYGEGQEFRALPIGPSCAVVLALSSMESTRLVLNSLPSNTPDSELVGRNLMTHLRSNMTVRVHREALGLPLATLLQSAALHVQGDLGNRRFHAQLFASADRDGWVEGTLYRQILDREALLTRLQAGTSDWITLRVLTSGEMLGSPDRPCYLAGTSWCDQAKFDFDELGGLRIPKLYTHWELSPEDDVFWQTMDEQALRLVQGLATVSAQVEFAYGGGWHTTPPHDTRIFRDSLGSTYHESGTLWMGEDPRNSVTTTEGRFHRVANLYCADQAIFPTVGSANPVLTGLTLGRRIVSHILQRLN